MAEKILMNKNTRAALKGELVEYRAALPIFDMKEQQLNGIVLAIENGVGILKEDISKTNEEVKSWVAVMAEEGVDLNKLVKVDQVITSFQEITGVTVENFVDIKFAKTEVDYFKTPMWVDEAINLIADQKTKQVMVTLEERKLALLQEALSEARRMKNALKEVFIPETIENIRKVEIYLGDVERLSIGCAKLVKKKKEIKRVAG